MADSKQQPMLDTKRKDLFFVDVRLIEVVKGFNVRKDYGDIQELADSIGEHGVRVPIRAYKQGDKFYLVDGHRRLMASKLNLKEGDEMRIPLILEPRKLSDEQRIVDMIYLNEGKKLNPLEEAEAISRLSKFGLTDTEISKKISKTLVYITNLKLLHQAPEKIKKMIISEQISATLVLKILRETDDFNSASALIQDAFKGAVIGSGEKTRITQKDVSKTQKKNNSFSALKKSFKTANKNDMTIKAGKEEMFTFALKIIEGGYSKEELLEMFFVNQKKNPSKDGTD